MPAIWDGNIRISARDIKFPYNAVEQANIKAQFAARAGFPNVIGAIDCTHIEAPSHDEFVYVNRKHFHSSNVKIICDAQMQLTNMWRGGLVLSNSIVGNRLQAGTVRDAWLLGE